MTGRWASLVSVACLAATLGLVESVGVSAARSNRSPLARSAQSTTDCDHDGDSPLGVEFEECGNAPAEPGKDFTPAEKAQYSEDYDDTLKLMAASCGASLSDPQTWVKLLEAVLVPATAFVDPCVYWKDYLLPHLDALIKDPPNPAVFIVALPVVPPANGSKPPRCTYGTRTCRRGGRLAVAYVQTLGQETAAAGALTTTLDRLSATPPRPESLYGSGAGATPLYSRRTQVAAARLYSGLLAAWSDRMKTSRANLIRFLGGLGGRPRRAARKLPPTLPSRLLWDNYHHMNVYEIAQLYSDLEAQSVEDYLATHPGSRPSGQLAARLLAGKRTLDQDMYNLFAATQGAPSTRVSRIAAAARTFTKDADKFATIPGLAAIAPNAPLSARLFGFAVEGLTTSKPKPPAAP